MNYNPEQSFEQNATNVMPLPQCDYRKQHWPTHPTIKCMDYTLATPFGVAACPASLGEPLRQLIHYGYSVLTYKTIRYHTKKALPAPNIGLISNLDTPLSSKAITENFSAKKKSTLNVSASTLSANKLHESLQDPGKISLVNSLGNPSLPLNWIINDLQKTKNIMQKGQILNVSIFADLHNTPEENNTCKKNLENIASIVKSLGADSIELNFSCPNVSRLPSNSEIVNLAQHIVKCTKPLPIIVKLGYIADDTVLCNLLTALARIGVRAVCAMNTLSLPVYTVDTKQAFFGKKRVNAGLSGYAIQQIALQYIARIAEINQQANLNLCLFGVGGAMSRYDLDKICQAGANIALSATAVMFNPLLWV